MNEQKSLIDWDDEPNDSNIMSTHTIFSGFTSTISNIYHTLHILFE